MKLELEKFIKEVREGVPARHLWFMYAHEITYEAMRLRVNKIREFDNGSRSQEEVEEYVKKVMRLIPKKIVPRKKFVSSKIIDQIHQLVDSGVSKEEVARKTGVNISTVYYYTDESFRNKKNKGTYRCLRDDVLYKIYELDREGLNKKEIAEKLGIPVRRVQYHLNVQRN